MGLQFEEFWGHVSGVMWPLKLSDSHATVMWHSAVSCWPLWIFHDKYQMSSCTVCLTRYKDTPVSLAIALIKFEGSLPITVLISPTNSLFFSYQNKQSEFPRAAVPLDSPNTVRILCTVLWLTPKHSEMFLLGLSARMPGNAVCSAKICVGKNCVMVLFLSQTALY